jgi:hypothetical protein
MVSTIRFLEPLFLVRGSHGYTPNGSSPLLLTTDLLQLNIPMLAENASSSSKEDFAVSPTSKRRSNSLARAGTHLARTEWPGILSYNSPMCPTCISLSRALSTRLVTKSLQQSLAAAEGRGGRRKG